MDTRFRIVSGGLLAVAIAVVAVQDQLSLYLPSTPVWAIVFTLLIIVLREIIKAYGNSLKGIVMDVRYRTLSAVLLVVALGIISLETTLTNAFPAYGTIISIIVIILREVVKDKGLSTETPKVEEEEVDTVAVDTITPEVQPEEIDEV